MWGFCLPVHWRFQQKKKGEREVDFPFHCSELGCPSCYELWYQSWRFSGLEDLALQFMELPLPRSVGLQPRTELHNHHPDSPVWRGYSTGFVYLENCMSKFPQSQPLQHLLSLIYIPSLHSHIIGSISLKNLNIIMLCIYWNIPTFDFDATMSVIELTMKT